MCFGERKIRKRGDDKGEQDGGKENKVRTRMDRKEEKRKIEYCHNK